MKSYIKREVRAILRQHNCGLSTSALSKLLDRPFSVADAVLTELLSDYEVREAYLTPGSFLLQE